MTLSTPLKTFIGLQGSIIRLGGAGKIVRVKASSGSASIFLSAWVTRTGETAASPEVDLCALGEHPDGIIIGTADEATDLDKDSDDAYADGTWLKMYIPEKGDQIACIAATNVSITANVEIQVSGGYIIAWAYNVAGGTVQTETRVGIIGKLVSAAIVAAASTEKPLFAELY